MKGFDYSNVKEEEALYDKLRPLGKKIINGMYDINYIGTENIPEEGGFIIASNHIRAFDPVYIAIGVEKRQIHFMAKKELFEIPVVKTLFKKANAFPIVRGGSDKEAIDYAERVVREGHILGIFPEGTRSKDYKPARARSGIGLIAKETKADILPVSIYNCDEMKKGTKLTIRFGELIPYEKLGFTEEGAREEVKNCAKFVMSEIVKLWGMGHCE
ncbi:MAG: 1-acyl-sn-glycerol-3-phosphate acyltransferase [Clostridia bacterium]|nr:1-acyl-sn-glycerol-3-phosphate acyltransferase [Clostridia bacterium]MBQ7121457.1 1-acyl-sn-glycerol-3-phosphate acyltransferase [Clostridia bacterium]